MKNVEKQNHFKHRVNANKSNSFNEQECQVIADRYADKISMIIYGLERISRQIMDIIMFIPMIIQLVSNM